MLQHTRPLLLAVAALGVMACKGSGPAAATEPATAPAAEPAAAPAEPVAVAAPVASVESVFKGRCAPCHGDTGKGDGPGGAALTPKARSFADAEWQKTATDDNIKKAILYGGAAIGKSPVMPSQPDLEGKPELEGLVKLIRSFGAAQ